MRLCSPSMPSSSGLGKVASIWIRQSRPVASIRGWPCLVAEGRGVFGAAVGPVACIHPIAEANSCDVPRSFHGSTPPTFLQLLGPSGGPLGHS